MIVAFCMWTLNSGLRHIPPIRPKTALSELSGGAVLCFGTMWCKMIQLFPLSSSSTDLIWLSYRDFRNFLFRNLQIGLDPALYTLYTVYTLYILLHTLDYKQCLKTLQISTSLAASYCFVSLLCFFKLSLLILSQFSLFPGIIRLVNSQIRLMGPSQCCSVWTRFYPCES